MTEKYVFIGHEFTLRGGIKAKFRKVIDHAFKGTPYTPLYSDDITNRHPTVLIDITNKIKKSEFCIFDLTSYKEKEKIGKNLNVILEIGISIGVGKQAFVAYKKMSIDFDKELSDLLGVYRYPYKGHKELTKSIKEFIVSQQTNEDSEKT